MEWGQLDGKTRQKNFSAQRDVGRTFACARPRANREKGETTLLEETRDDKARDPSRIDESRECAGKCERERDPEDTRAWRTRATFVAYASLGGPRIAEANAPGNRWRKLSTVPWRFDFSLCFLDETANTPSTSHATNATRLHAHAR